MRLLRLLYAVRDIPLRRNLYRVYIRGLRFVLTVLPGLFFLIRYEVSSLKGNRKLNKELLERVKDYYQSLESIVFEGGRVKVFSEEFDSEWLAKEIFSLKEGSNSLKKMSVTYFGYIHKAYSKDPEALNLFLARILATIQLDRRVLSRGALKHVWHPYTASHRVINLCAYLSYADVGCELKRLILLNIKDSLSVIQLFKEYELHYNHYSKNLVALSIAQEYLGAKGWVDKRELIDALTYQVNAEGVHAELAPMYHFLFVKDLAVLAECASLGELVIDQIHSLRINMLEAGKVFEACGQICLFGDSWRGEVEVPVQSMELSGAATCGELYLPSSGYYKYRSKKYTLLADLGSFGALDNPGHGHSDAMSIELYSGGEQVVFDYGVPTYAAGEAREFSRSSWAHNAPCIVERDFNEMWSSFRVGRRSKPVAVTRDDNGVHMTLRPYFFSADSYISRKISMSLAQVEIEDVWVLSGVDSRLTPYLQYLVGSEVSVLFGANGVGCSMCITDGGGVVSSGEYFPVFGRPEPCKRVAIVPRKVKVELDNKVRYLAKVVFNLAAEQECKKS